MKLMMLTAGNRKEFSRQSFITRPAEEQENKMKEFLRSQFSAREVELTLTEDKSLVGGFVLRAGDREYDWSLIGRYKKLKQKLTRR